jgi:glycine reductase
LVSQGLRVVHYLNQFFGGLGGEEKAHIGPQLREGFVGPGKVLHDAVKGRGEVVATIICGDNYFAERTEEAVQQILQMVTPCRPDILIAGPAFNAGRYGIACGELCKAVQDRLGIPAATGMYEENPGVDLYRREVYIVKTAESVRGMPDIISQMVALVLKLVDKKKIGRPAEEGYFPRGIARDESSDMNAAERAIAMVLAKIKGAPFESEIESPKFDKVKPAPPVKDMASATIALATDGGLVRRGNPEKLDPRGATWLRSYNVKGLKALNPEDFACHHSGFDTVFVSQDPNRLVPVDVMRDLENEGVIGKLHDKVCATAGVAASLSNAKKVGESLAEQLKAEGVDGVILTST